MSYPDISPYLEVWGRVLLLVIPSCTHIGYGEVDFSLACLEGLEPSMNTR